MKVCKHTQALAKRNTKAAWSRFRVFQCLLLLFLPHQGTALAAELFTAQDIFTYTEAVPVSFLKDKWSAPYSAGNSSEGYVWLESGYKTKHWGVSMLYRFDVQAQYEPQTIDFFFHVKNKRLLDETQDYALSMDFYQHRSTGLRTFFNHSWKNLQLQGGISFLRAHFLTHGELKGTVNSLSASDYDFQFSVDYAYSEDYLFDRSVEAPIGWGLSTDLDLSWKATSSLLLELRVIDLAGFIYWPNAPSTKASADTSVKQYDENGYLFYQPIMSGKEDYRAYMQYLPPRATLAAQYRINNIYILGETLVTRLAIYPRLGFAYTLPHVRLSFSRALSTHAYGIGLEHHYWALKLTLDSLGTEHLHHVNAHFSVRLPLSYL